VIVGAGFGGLTASIEARLKGHTVSVLEKAPRWEQHGDIISISELKLLCPLLRPSSTNWREEGKSEGILINDGLRMNRSKCRKSTLSLGPSLGQRQVAQNLHEPQILYDQHAQRRIHL